MQYWESEMRMLFHTAVDRLLRCLSSTMGSLKADRPPACTVPEHFVLYPPWKLDWTCPRFLEQTDHTSHPTSLVVPLAGD